MPRSAGATGRSTTSAPTSNMSAGMNAFPEGIAIERRIELRVMIEILMGSRTYCPASLFIAPFMVLGQKMTRIAWAAVLAAIAFGSAPAQDKVRPPVVLKDDGRQVHIEGFVFDGHNDLPWEMRTKADSSFDKRDIRQAQPRMQTDIPRLKAGGVRAQFWSVYVPAETAKKGTALADTLEQIALVKTMIERYPDVFEA